MKKLNKIKILLDKKDIEKDKNIKSFLKALEENLKLMKKHKVKIKPHFSKAEDVQKLLVTLSFSLIKKLFFELSIINPKKIVFYHGNNIILYKDLEYLILNDEDYL